MLQYLPLAIGGLKTVGGLIQAATATRPERPEYEIPDEVFEALDIYRNRTKAGLPGGDIIRGNVVSDAEAQMTNIKDVASGASLQGQVAATTGNVLSGLREIDILESQFRDQATQQYAEGLGVMAQYEDRAWNLNVREPYLSDLNEYYNQKQAGWQNFTSGLTEIGGYGMSLYENNQIDDMLEGLWKDGAAGDSADINFNPSGMNMPSLEMPNLNDAWQTGLSGKKKSGLVMDSPQLNTGVISKSTTVIQRQQQPDNKDDEIPWHVNEGFRKGRQYDKRGRPVDDINGSYLYVKDFKGTKEELEAYIKNLEKEHPGWKVDYEYLIGDEKRHDKNKKMTYRVQVHSPYDD